MVRIFSFDIQKLIWEKKIMIYILHFFFFHIIDEPINVILGFDIYKRKCYFVNNVF